MGLLQKIRKGPAPGPRRILIYGQGGVGKSTFGANADSPVFIPTEDGLNDIDCESFPVAGRFDDVMTSLESLFTENHDYRTVVVDSLDWLEKLIWQTVCERHNVEGIEDISYAKGYMYALKHWRHFLDGLSQLREVKQMSVILVAHSKIEKFADPETDTYDRHSPALHKNAAATVMEWCDEVLFARFPVSTRQVDENFKKRTLAFGSNDRVLKTTERPAYQAKNRLSLPDEIKLEKDTFNNFFSFKGGKVHV